MISVASIFDGVLPLARREVLTCAAIMSGPVFIYYPIMVLAARGWRRASSATIATVIGFVLLAPIAVPLGDRLGGFNEGDVRPLGCIAMCMGLAPSCILGVTLWADTRSLYTAATPLIASIALAGLATTLTSDAGSTRVIVGIVAWHLTLGAVLLIDAVPRWREQARPKGTCPACGYNLAGLPPGPCPECGKLQSRSEG